jgi:diaminopimelate epimerase
MKYYNADGSYGGMCGNGGRCVALFCVSAGIAENSHTFEAVNYVYRATVRKNYVTLRMKDPSNLTLNIALKTSFGTIPAHYVDTGAPHVIIDACRINKHIRKLEEVPVVELGREIRNHAMFQPEGTNVNFIERVGAKSLRIRTFERGVENETLACGTGAIASAIVASLAMGLKTPITVQPKSNATLRVAFRRNGEKIRDVSLSGPATMTFEGDIEI